MQLKSVKTPRESKRIKSGGGNKINVKKDSKEQLKFKSNKKSLSAVVLSNILL